MLGTIKHGTVGGTGGTHGTGWLPPRPDLRDFTEEQPDIAALAKKMGVPQARAKAPKLRQKIDLSPWCSAIENQGVIGSCTAHAAVGIVEYFEKRAFGQHIDGSRLFVYKATRNLMGVNEDTGAYTNSQKESPMGPVT